MSEPEIDLRRYWSAVAARWWLPVLGLVAGAAIGYALSLGGQDVWRAQALVYLGQPVTPSGAQVQSLATNPAVVGEIVGSAAVQRRVAAQVGMERRDLASGTSVAAVKGNLSRLGQNPLVRVTVKGDSRFKTAAAANALARIAVDRVSGYANKKIALLKQTIADEEQELGALDGALDDASAADRGFLLLRRGELNDEVLKSKEELALAEEVERGQVVENAVARKVTAQSRRNQIIVGAFLGLLLGLAAALVWESSAALRRR
jgi:uncharacterized protein involved in exopolysaccharide biosynthesis